MSNNCKLFEGFKSVGLVSGSVPHIIRYIDKLSQIRIITASNNSFLVFNNKLKLIETCVAHESDINVLTSDSKYVFTAADNQIYGWKYGHKWKAKSFKGCLQRVTHILPFGPHLIAIDRENVLRVWELRNEELSLTLPFDVQSFEMTAILHPSTYVNKVVIGSRQGSLQLWNIRTQKCIYTFNGWRSKVTQLCQAPAIDIVAVGLENGSIFIHNLKSDETLMKFKQEWGSVLSLAFRSDGKPFLISSSTGHLAVWNLEHKRLESQMRDIHFGAIVGVNFIEREALLVTNSTDNSLKVWCFDQSDSSGRILYQREGHNKPPTRIRFHGAKGQYVLSAGLDSTLRAFSIFSERLNRNLGSASYDRKLAKKKGVRRDPKKMPPIVEFTTENTREKEWDGLAACHRRVNVVTTWSFDKMKMGEHKLLHQRFNGQYNVVALCVCLSSCGNFVIIGYNTGHIDRFNIQSGIHRATYGKNKAHDGPVRGVASDCLNQIVISGGSDSNLKFWRFNAKELLSTIALEAPINQMIIHKESSLLSVSLDNFFVNVVDCETRRVIRVFGPHGNRVTDMAFNNECRWIITSSMDSIIRVWDLPLGLLVDAFRVSSPCVSLSFSPTGEFLATAHSEGFGIYLWANVSIYSSITLRPLPEDFEPVLLQLPTIRTDEEEEEENDQNDNLNDEKDDQEMDVNQDIVYKSPQQLSEELITLSSLPNSRWKNLLNLDIIKKRNKPKDPPKKPESAPFFLPTVAGLEPKFAIEPNKANEESIDSHIIQKLKPISSFGELLIICSTKYDYWPLLDALKSLGPSAVDAEIRSLSTNINGSQELMLQFLEGMEQLLKKNKDFELIQSYLGLFLKIHTEEIANNSQLNANCQRLSTLTEESWNRLSNQFNRSLCLVNYLRSAVL